MLHQPLLLGRLCLMLAGPRTDRDDAPICRGSTSRSTRRPGPPRSCTPSAAYFRSVSPHDAAWATSFLTGRPLKRVVSRDLRDAALAARGCRIGSSKRATMPPATSPRRSRYSCRRVRPATLALSSMGGARNRPTRPRLPPADVQSRLAAEWRRLDRDARFVHIKLLTGGFRVGVAKQLVDRALAAATGVADDRRGGATARLVAATPDFPRAAARKARRDSADSHRPYPFFLAHPLDASPPCSGRSRTGRRSGSGTASARNSSVRDGAACVWSRGEELVDDAFPEIDRGGACAARRLRDRWRDPRLAIRPRVAVPFRLAADAREPQAAERETAARRARDAVCVRSPRARWGGRASAAPGRAT